MAKILLLLLFLIFAGCSPTVTRGTGGNTEAKSMDLVGFNRSAGAFCVSAGDSSSREQIRCLHRPSRRLGAQSANR